jgi:hypothetical protein
MKLPADLVPQKVVAADFCISLVTLWRARKAGIPGFPEPVMFQNLICWRKSDLCKLEDALLRYSGRVAFERQRNAARRVEALKRAKARAQGKAPRGSIRPPPGQSDLFER